MTSEKKRAAQPGRSTAGHRWEYRGVVLPPGSDESLVAQIKDVLAPLGAEGWELVTGIPGTSVFILRRRSD